MQYSHARLVHVRTEAEYKADQELIDRVWAGRLHATEENY